MTDLAHDVAGRHDLTDRARALLDVLLEFRRRLTAEADDFDGSTTRAARLEGTTARYTDLVTDPANDEPFAELRATGAIDGLVDDLRRESARCASVMEKLRGLLLLAGDDVGAAYFDNVESCIDSEFGALAPTAESAVLLVGSGAYPMTLLNVAARTGADVAGVDIDDEAVEISRRVVGRLAPDLSVTLASVPADALPFTGRATHVVFSSTVAAKYDLLDRLHGATRDDVVVAMRFGDGLRSLFNYPRQDVDPARWRLVRTVRRPGQVFDVALYVKASAGAASTASRPAGAGGGGS